ncbi:hemagglutinin repeat-containing protein [Dyella silvatica]|uniref:hemagglutinin repeat-containing protein n=1 Tax=Dyella silvatica TaxID=2992128 RepID=UPI00225661E5|nr:hemagglutinin repeat-containing protein [Dyella silvatica]
MSDVSLHAASATPAHGSIRPSRTHLLRRHALWAALTVACGLPSVYAQSAPPVHVDGSTNTAVIQAANGVPVVNIAAPNQAGLSHNRYQQFDVNSQGLILNNSGAITSTKLAGFIYGNTNLPNDTSARLILNEVTSTLPSQLNGMIEVAGRAADVIIANPNGIAVNGGGFINAPHSVLTTGTPVIGADGALSGFRVTGGRISIDGQLDASSIDRVDLIARAVAVNAGIWANQLNVVTGANQVDAATLATQKLSNSGATPAVALDVSALGGMYAGVIRLVGTEAGLGVNNQGQIAAKSGDLSLTNAGQIVLGGKTSASGNVTVQSAQSLSSSGTLAAGGGLNVGASDISHSGVLYSGGSMNLVAASGALSNSGQIQSQGALTLQANGAVTNTASGMVLTGNAINLSAGSLDNAGKLEAAQGVHLQVSSGARNSGSVLADQGDLALQADTLDNTGTLSASGDTALTAVTSLNTQGSVLSGGALTLTAPSLTTAGTVQAGQSLSINGGSLGNSGKLYALVGDAAIHLSGVFNNASQGDLYAGNNLGISAASLINAGRMEAKQAANITLSGALSNSGHLQADQTDVLLSANALDNSGVISAQRLLQWQVVSTASNSGTLISGQASHLSAQRFDNSVGGQLQSGSDLTLSAVTLNNAGNLHAKGNASVSGTDLSNAVGAQLLADGTLTVNNTGAIENAGVMQAGSDLTLANAASFNNAQNATVYAGQNLNLVLTQALTNAGTFYAAHMVSLAAGNVGNSGILRSGGGLSLNTTGDVNSSGAIQAQQQLSLTSGGSFTNSGKLYAVDSGLTIRSGGAFVSKAGGDIYSGQNITFHGGSFANAGLLEAKQAISLGVQGDVGNSGSIQADSGDLALSGATLNNQGTLSATGNTQLNGSTSVSNAGRIVTGQALTIASASLSNSGQTQSGTSTALQTANLDNRGRIQAGSTLTLSGNRTLTNASGGQLLATGDLNSDTAVQLSNAGVIQAGGKLGLQGTGAIDNQAGGTLYATGQTQIELGGALNNAGTVYAGQGLQLDTNGLSNSGSLRSGTTLNVSVQGNASNSGSAYAMGAAIWNVTSALANTGVLAAAGTTTVTANSLSGAGTLAAGLQSDGSLGAAGALAVTTSGALASNGRALAGGDIRFSGSSLDLSNSQTRAGGDAILMATQGDVSNQGGDIAANGTLAITTPGAFINGGSNAVQGGKLSASVLSLHAASVMNRYGSISQSGNRDIALSLTGALDNAYGKFASNAGNISISAASLDNTGGTLQHAGSGNLSLTTAGDLSNNSGQIVGNGALTLQAGGTLSNAGGNIGVANEASVHAAAMVNNSGTLAARHIGLNVDQALSNNGGTMQASGGLTVTANTLDNTGGFLKSTSAQAVGVTTTGALTNGSGGFIGGNGVVAVQAGSLTNAGQIYAGSSLTATSQNALNNNGGALQALSWLNVNSAGALSNRSGRIEAGAGDGNATLTVNAASLDNAGGRLANAGGGVSTVNAGSGVTNQGGTLGGQGDLNLSANSLDNSQGGHVVAGQNLNFTLNGMSNVGGTTYAANNLGWSNGGAWLANASGALSAGGQLGLSLQNIDNNGGDLAAGSNLNLNLASFSGVGRTVAGQDLTLSVGGDYTNATGNTLKANRDFTFNIAGNFYNPAGATLQSVRNLTVNAANIDNAASAYINSNGTTLNARGNLSNEGRIEGDAITLNAVNLSNTGNIIGGAIAATASTLTNGADLGAAADNAAYQSAMIAATRSIDLFVSGTLLNRDATIFTLGNLRIGADANGNRSGAVINQSGDIEADGNVTLAANSFTNQRRVFETGTYQLSADEVLQNTFTGASVVRYRYDDPNPLHHPPYVDASQVIGAQELALSESWCANRGEPGSDGAWCNGNQQPGHNSHDLYHYDFQAINTDKLISVERLKRASAEGRLLAGGDITLSGSVLNDKSTVAAGRNLTINGADSAGNTAVQNIAWAPTGTVQRHTDYQVGISHLAYDGGRHWAWWRYETWNTGDTSIPLGLGAGQVPAWVNVALGNSLGAVMSAGNTVNITAQTISSSVVGADGQPVRNAIGLGANGGGQSISGNGVGPVGSVAGHAGAVAGTALGEAPGASSGGSLSLASGRYGVTAGALAPSTTVGATPGVGQAVSALAGPNPTVNLPQSGLYTVNNQPGSKYLVETDPRFAQYTAFTSSDYMMSKLGFDPSNIRKRLGDGFYEQRSVLDQIASLTGRRFLNDNTNAMAQYRDLMDAGAQAAGAFQLSVGVALTSAQMAHLTQDIVWMVNATVDGQTVLVPVVYLSEAHAREMAANGATIAGKNVILTATGDLTNSGTIKASDSAQLTAANLLNSGNISAGNNLSVTAAQNILNGGTINAGGNVSLVAGNDVRSGLDAAVALGAVNLTNLGAPVSTVAGGLDMAQPGSISTGGSLAINAGRDLTLSAAPVSAGGNLSLAAGRDLSAAAVAISAGKDAQLLAGRDLSLNALGHTTASMQAQGSQNTRSESTTHTVSTINTGGSLLVAAGRDLTSQGAQLKAGDQLALSAGRDASLNAVTDVQSKQTESAQGHTVVQTSQRDESLRGSNLSAANGVSVTATRDLAATAVAIATTQGGPGEKGNVILGAGRDLTLNAGQENHDSSRDTITKKSGFLSSSKTTTHDATHDEYVIGSKLNGNNVVLSAGHDLTAQAAQVTTPQGTTQGGLVALSAGHDVNLTDAHDVHSEEHDRKTTSSSVFSTSALRFGSVDPQKRSRDDNRSLTQTTSVGTLLSGDTVTVAAGHDLNATAAQVAATRDVVLAAGNDLNLKAGENTYTETQGTKTSHTGLMNNGGLSVLIGNRTQETTSTVNDTSYTGSMVGSTNGKVTLSAGNNVHITGSDVISQTGTAIVGKNVTIDAAVGTTDTRQTQKMSQGGINVGIGGVLAEAAQGVYGSVKRGSEVKDDRLKALYAAQAAYQASDGMKAYNGGAATASKNGGDGGINLQVGIGGSSASSQTTTHDETAYGSHIRSQGDVTIAATGGDLNIIGSQVTGNNVALAAKNDINLLSQAENHTLQSSNKNASGGLGLQIGTDGVGFYAQASMGKGKAHGNGATHAETVIDAKDTLSLISGNDTTIRGAQAKGSTVLANIGGNLNLASEQDTNDYASQQWQAGAKVVIGYGGSASASYNQSKVTSNYKSVNEVSGISTGSGGYDIRVGGNTDLKGAVIASTADAAKNLLSTGSLTFSDIQNEAKYSASSVGVSASYGGGSFSAMPSVSIPQHENSSSDTKAGIAQGTINVRNNPGQDLSGLDRNPDIDGKGLKPIFDEQKVRENMELGQVAGYVGMRSVGEIAQWRQKEANQKLNQAAEDYKQAKANGDQAGMERADQAWNSASADYRRWSDGSANMALVHGVMGAAIAALGGGNAAQGALGAAAGEAATPVLANELGRNGAALGAALIGNLAGGGSGAATANAGAQYNYLSHDQEALKLKEIQACNGNVLCQLQVTAKWDIVSGKQDVGVGVGVVAGIGMSGRNALDAIAYMEPKDVLAGLKALVTDPNVRAQIAPSMLKSIDERLSFASQQMEVAGWDASVDAGKALGSLLFDTAAAVSAVRGGIALAKDLPAVARNVAGAVDDLSALLKKGANGAADAPSAPKFVLIGGASYVESAAIQANTTVSLSADVTIATGEVIPKGSLVTVSGDTMKVVFPDGRKVISSYGVATGEVPVATGAKDIATVDAEIDALGRIAQNPNGPDLTARAPNTILNKQLVNDLGNGKLPGNPIGGPGTPREMPFSPNPSATAEDFAQGVLGRSPTQDELNIGARMNKGNCIGCWVASPDNGQTFITYRPSGMAGADTLPTTSTVEINYKGTENIINNGKVVKLKFPKN